MRGREKETQAFLLIPTDGSREREWRSGTVSSEEHGLYKKDPRWSVMLYGHRNDRPTVRDQPDVQGVVGEGWHTEGSDCDDRGTRK